MFKVGVIHRYPNQVSLVLVKLGGKLILQFGNFCLVLLPDVDTPGQCNKIGDVSKIMIFLRQISNTSEAFLDTEAVLTVQG